MRRLAPAIALFSVTCVAGLRAQGVPAAIPLRLVAAGAHQAEVRIDANEAVIRTRGVDPYVYCAEIAANYDPQQLRILSFEYSCAATLDSLQVFYGPPIRAGAVADGGALAATGEDQYLPFALDLAAAGRNWGHHRRIRLDFGKRPGRRIKIRRLELRAPNLAERRAIALRGQRAARDARRAEALAAYLDQDFPARIESVTVGEVIVVRGRAPALATGHRLIELPPWVHLGDGDDHSSARSWPVRPDAAGRFVVRLARRDRPSTWDRSLSRFAIAATQTAVLRSHACFPTTFVRPDAKRIRRPVPRSKKGMGGIAWFDPMMSDLTDLGVHNITLNISLPAILRLAPGRETRPFAFAGHTYHVSKPALRHYDRLLGFAAKQQMIVSAILLIPRRQRDAALRRVFVHPEASAPGIYSMANLTSAEGCRAFAAVMTLLARRYGAGKPGTPRIHNWILHNEVDAGYVWTNAGEKRALTYLELYHRAMRLTYACVRASDPQARVFISLTHHFARTPRPRFYPGRDLLDWLARFTQREGEFEWGVAYHPYPENLRDPRSWRDRQSKFAFDTPQITFRNIEVLDAYLRQQRFLYRGKQPRGVLLSEQGLNSGDNSARALRLQSAGLAYAWLKVNDIPCVEAFHYHRWIDHEHEDGLRLGLWTVVPGSITRADSKKPAWTVYRAMGTPTEDETCAPFLKMFGVPNASALRYRGAIK